MRGLFSVKGGGDPDPVQVCRCHTHDPAEDGQILYKPGNWKLDNKDMHLSGCPTLRNATGFIMSS